MFYNSSLQIPQPIVEEFKRFKTGLESTILNINNSNPFLTIFFGDFNAKNPLWWSDAICNSEGLELNELSSHYNLHQLINTPTHILRLLIFRLHSNPTFFLSETGVHASVFPRCHNQIVFEKVSLKVFYPPPYESLVCGYSKAELSNVRKSLSHIN